ncbi:ATP-dependent zinc metalloprotease FtsH [Deinococcus radiodurans]|jgi:membrane protease FtsH catalytic subunit (EC 3.4.24.-)|uniref:ATP-dependent zinc metalloprotease FtsH n=1 Tax=Deinococcus radiodurans (strain ATCC 13939 / DSM 20539 / JCM 16871 / CCUG 27074 / LMG 4051 / NBRC 15346 / NCIMB 9279 / VKM B-1422 / R1) TaxID=243230 RepID=Q9RVK7_DEIRA|nr:cell division protein FtsH [Deinococcus radiodurans R1 = ATCC 13939 = DSM 20539]ANC71794.1 cell division protein FtsH [Deinococcus radiodurans R1 = ATCC 13939 = DSM 20539]QEM70511.1 ATP-dependent metallopeptidase FtsH/Yme1/Tma family protein [Deinococcus radiodurans]UDL00162.1 ATP-dependent metallopeptidase FtsH/Yme1/Tma family protein [Deinococcus radiodurans R1 = ATCC 13939 = DSM 20539]UID70013.1 cell division protein FtsH [Deinococcus radiodurans R1 = ATCC 13939 = DSM 20539]
MTRRAPVRRFSGRWSSRSGSWKAGLLTLHLLTLPVLVQGTAAATTAHVTASANAPTTPAPQPPTWTPNKGNPRLMPENYTVNRFFADLQAGKVERVKLDGAGNTQVFFKEPAGGPNPRWLLLPPDAATLARLRGSGVTMQVTPGGSRFAWLGQALPLVLTALILAVLWRSLRGNGGGGASSFAKSKAAIISEGQIKLTFADVAGCDEAKQDLQEVVDFLRQPEKYHQLGARIPHGVLLVGPPGSGKTLLAKAVAGEAKVPYFSISGSDFVEMFVGVGAARVRDLFEQARKSSPCIVFIDEIDAVGRKRGMNIQGGNDEREQTLNQLLVEMDGFGSGQDVIILAATNRPDVLDAALLRPGRFDRQVVVDAPDVRGREQILRIHSRKKPLDVSVDLGVIARRTAGMVGADLENLLNEAALLAAREGRNRITGRDVDEARDRVLMGPERRSMVVREADRKVTAYHEVGHALAAQLLPNAHRVAKLTVVPRGRAAGYMLPDADDRLHVTRAALEDMIAVALAGRAAEEVVYGEVTTGAQNDFQQATGLARRMVTEWGMSGRIGKVALASDEGNYLGGGPQPLPTSEHTSQVVDEEVRALIDAAYARVLALLREYLPQVHQIVTVLMQRETLSGEEFATLLAGGSLEPLPPVGQVALAPA